MPIQRLCKGTIKERAKIEKEFTPHISNKFFYIIRNIYSTIAFNVGFEQAILTFTHTIILKKKLIFLICPLNKGKNKIKMSMFDG